jgi:2-oxo-4-hydroxy-4-carboxy-5-ureidoimidazoline decarboxylase
MTLDKLNTLSPRDAVTFFRQCCGSAAWVSRMEQARPFRDRAALHAAALDTWKRLAHADWKEAFSHHPKIGDLGSLRAKFAATAHLAEGEQAAVAQTPEPVLRALADANALYEAKFGYIFIVCATGKTAEEMLAILKGRLDNVPGDEIALAAAEQAKITALRLDKLLGGAGADGATLHTGNHG